MRSLGIRNSQQPIFRPLGIFPLEDRRVLSVTAGVVLGDVLSVVGDAASDDVSVQLLNGGTDLELRDGSNNLITIDGNNSVSLADISGGLQIDLGEGNDTLSLPVLQNLSITILDDATGSDEVNLTGQLFDTAKEISIDAESIQLKGRILSTSDLSFIGSTTLKGNVNLAAEEILFQGTLAGELGTETVTISSSSKILLADNVHNLKTIDLTSTGSIDFESTVTGTGTGRLLVDSDANVRFGEAVSHFRELSIKTPGVTEIQGDITDVESFNTDSPGTTILDTSLISVNRFTTADEVVLGQSLELNATDSINFRNTLSGVTGAESLQVTQVNSLNFWFEVTNLQDITIVSASSLNVAGNMNLAGSLLQNAGTQLSLLTGDINAASVEIHAESIQARGNIFTHSEGITLDAPGIVLITSTLNTLAAGSDGEIQISAEGAIFLQNNGMILSDNANIELIADDATANATGILLMSDGSIIQSNSQSVSLVAAGTVRLGEVISGSTADNAITVTSRLGSITDAGDAGRDLVTIGGVILSSRDGTGTSFNPIETDVDRITITNQRFGDIAISEKDGLIISGISQQATRTTQGVFITTEAGDLTVSQVGTGITSQGKDVTLDAQSGGSLEIGAAISTGGGDLTLLADSGITTLANGSLSTTGLFQIDSGNLLAEVRQTGAIDLQTSVTTKGGQVSFLMEPNAGTITLLTNAGDITTSDLNSTGGNRMTIRGGDAGEVQITAGAGNIFLHGAITATGGSGGTTAGTDALVQLIAENSIFDINDENTVIQAGDFSATAIQNIGEISDIAAGVGNGIDISLSGQLLKAEVSLAGGSISLNSTSNLQVAAGAVVPADNVAASLLLKSEGNLDLSALPDAMVLSSGDQVHLFSEKTLMIPDAGLDVGSGQLWLTGVEDIVDASGRELGKLEAENLVFTSGSAGGTTVLNTAVDRLSATITTAGMNLEIVEADGLVVDLLQVENADINLMAATGSPGNIEVSHINAGTGNVFLGVANRGEIVDVDETLTDVVAGSLAIDVTAGIANGNQLEVELDQLAARTAAGEISILNLKQGLEITEVKGVSGLQITEETNTNSIDVQSFGMLEVLKPIVNSGTGDLFLTASGNSNQATLSIQSTVTTAGGNINLLADQSVLLGENATVQSNNGILRVLADNDLMQTGNSGDILMADTAKIDSGSGDIDLQADGEIRLGQIRTTGDALLNSSNGTITDGGDAGGVDIAAARLAIRAKNGVGFGDALETTVAEISILNTQSGNIEIDNLSAEKLTVGLVDGLIGISQTGTNSGDIVMTNAASLLVDAEINNETGGSIELTAGTALLGKDLIIDAPLRAEFIDAATGNIILNSGRDLLINDNGLFIDLTGGAISGHAVREILIADDVIIQSATGAIIQKLPLLENILTPQVKASGEATVAGDFGRLNEVHFAITIDWADGTVETFDRPENTPSNFLFNHFYIANPDPLNPAADIPITVSIADDVNILFTEQGQELLLPPIVSFAPVPGEGLAGSFAYDLSVEVPPLESRTNSGAEASINSTTESTEQQIESESVIIVEDAQVAEKRIVKLRVFNAEGAVREEIVLEGDQALKLLNNFVDFVEEHELPDGRYQILQQEPGDLRMRIIYDLLLRNGKPADNSQGLQDRPPTDN